MVAASATPPPPHHYLDTTLGPEQRAKDLVSRLSLEQQVNLLLAQAKRTGGVPEYNITDYNWWTECNSGIMVQYVVHLALYTSSTLPLVVVAPSPEAVSDGDMNGGAREHLHHHTSRVATSLNWLLISNQSPCGYNVPQPNAGTHKT
jgi:hypothetical protein